MLTYVKICYFSVKLLESNPYILSTVDTDGLVLQYPCISIYLLV